MALVMDILAQKSSHVEVVAPTMTVLEATVLMNRLHIGALVVTVGGWLARVRSRRPVRAALRGLTPAVVGLMAAATFSLGRSLEGAADLAIAAASFLTLARFKVNPAWVMVLGGAVRLVLYASGRAGL